jgi:hypothetical protein
MLGTVLKAVEGGFAAVAEDIPDLRRETKDDIAAVKKDMATKRDILGIMDEGAPTRWRNRANSNRCPMTAAA